MQRRNVSFRELIESGVPDPGYEAAGLWLLPILLRPRIQYYKEMAARIRLQIDRLWDTSGYMFGSREKFEQSDTVDTIWRIGSPPWWGLNDIVGYIDIRLLEHSRQIWVALFLPTKRISRQLVQKVFAINRLETIYLDDGPIENELLRQKLIETVEAVRHDPRVERLYVDVDRWRLCVFHTDLVGILRELENQVRGKGK